MVKIDYEKLLHRYKRAVISQDKIYKLALNGYGFDENIKDVDKEVKDLEAQLLERLRRDERRDEANNDKAPTVANSATVQKKGVARGAMSVN